MLHPPHLEDGDGLTYNNNVTCNLSLIIIMESYFALNVIILLLLKSSALLNRFAQVKDAFVCFHANKTKKM
jgi:hypothetical protein